MQTIIEKSQQLCRLLFTISLFITLAACGGTDSTPATPIVKNDATLKSLTLSAGTLKPVFASDTTDYKLTTKATSTQVTATTQQDKASIQLSIIGRDGTITLSSGVASTAIALSEGDTSIRVTITAEDGSTIKIYNIIVTQLSSNANLSNLTLSAGTLSPAFASDITDYKLTTKATSTEVTATTQQDKASIQLNIIGRDGTIALSSGVASDAIALSEGDTSIRVTITAEDGSTIKTYNIIISQISLSNLTLTAGTLSPVFASDITDYTLTTKATSTQVTATTQQDKASIQLNIIGRDGTIALGSALSSGVASDAIALSEGDTNIRVTITAEDGSTIKTYNIIVTQLALSNLTLSAGILVPEFAPDVDAYTLVTTSENTTVTATASASTTAANASIKVNETVINSGIESSNFALVTGQNIIDLVLTAKNGTQTYQVKVNRVGGLELLDPHAAVGHKFGEKIVQLGNNGNIVVHVPADTTQGKDSGAIHLYQPISATAVSSLYGKAEDKLGSGGIVALANNNFLVVSPFADKDTLDAAGAVKLVNGTNGNTIKTFTGDRANDQLGSGGVILLDDTKFAIVSPNYQKNNAAIGSVWLVSIEGDVIKKLDGDAFGISANFADKGVTALGNGKFVITSTRYSYKTHLESGLVQLVNGAGEVIKTLNGQGQKAYERFGAGGITRLQNHNFLISTATHNASAELTNAGSIQLVNGDTGDTIGDPVLGDRKEGYFGLDSTTSITRLGNSNYVVNYSFPDRENLSNPGSIRLFSGTNGQQIGATLSGKADLEFSPALTNITALSNDNFVVTTLLFPSGSIRLMNGANGSQIGDVATVRGYEFNSIRVIELNNHKYVLATPTDNTDEIFSRGAVMVFSADGKSIDLATRRGTAALDGLGSHGLSALGNNKFVIASADYDEGGVIDTGSIQLIDAKDSNQESPVIFAGDANDRFGNGGVTLLNHHNFVFAATDDNVDGKAKVGSVHVVNGTTGQQVGNPIIGANTGDMQSVQMIKPIAGDYFILSQPMADNNGLADSGKLRLILPKF